MIFGRGFLLKSLFISGALFTVSLLIIAAASGHITLNGREYDSLKQKQALLLDEERQLKLELKVLKTQFERFNALPLSFEVEHFRAKILDLLRDLAEESKFSDLEFQFYERELMQLSETNGKSPKVSVDSLMLNGRIRHMEEFFKVLDFLVISDESYEIRGCEIIRKADGHSSTKKRNRRNLDVRCLLSWYARSESRS